MKAVPSPNELRQRYTYILRQIEVIERQAQSATAHGLPSRTPDIEKLREEAEKLKAKINSLDGVLLPPTSKAGVKT